MRDDLFTTTVTAAVGFELFFSSLFFGGSKAKRQEKRRRGRPRSPTKPNFESRKGAEKGLRKTSYGQTHSDLTFPNHGKNRWTYLACVRSVRQQGSFFVSFAYPSLVR